MPASDRPSRFSGPHPRVLAAAALALLGACVTVPSGDRAVVVGPRGGVEVLGEGSAFIAPLSQTRLYNVRRLESNENLTALTSDGAPVAAGSSLVAYRVPPDELVALNRETGPDYYRKLVRPILLSATRRVLSRYRWRDLLDPANVLSAQQDLIADAAARLRPRHVILDSVVVRGVFLDLPATSAAITDTGVWEQKVLEARENVRVAEQRARALRRTAEGTASAHDRVRPTLTPEILEDEDRRAWSRLLESPGTEIVTAADGPTPVVEIRP